VSADDYSSHLAPFKGDEVTLRGDGLRGLVTKVTATHVWVLWDGQSKAAAMSPLDVLPYNGPETHRDLPRKYASRDIPRRRT
jgi:hypothetical protein